jgi:hypothetical protein
MNPDELSVKNIINKIKSGEYVSDEEVSYIGNQVEVNPTGQAIQAFAATHEPTEKNVSKILAFWNDDVDDYVCSSAISAICGPNGWELAKSYVERLMTYSAVERWEKRWDSVIRSLSSLGYYLHNTQDPEIYERLLNRLLTLPVVERGVNSRFDEDYENCLFDALLYGVTGHHGIAYKAVYHKNRESEDKVLDMVREKIRLGLKR